MKQLIDALRSYRYVRMLRNYRLEKEPDLLVVRKLLKPGDIVIDIGASIGLYAYHMSRFIGPTGVVYACEPMPDTCRILKHNLRGLGVWNAVVFETALSDKSGQAYMSIPEGKSHYYASIASDKGVEVRANTVDNLFKHLRDVAFVKCDVEGHEPKLLEGSVEFFKNNNAIWLIEMDKQGEAIERFFTDHGYKPYPTGTANCFFSRTPIDI